MDNFFDPNRNELKVGSDLFYSVIGNASDGIFAFDQNGFISVWNSSISDLSGRTFEQVKNLPVNQVFYFLHESDHILSSILEGKKVDIPTIEFNFLEGNKGLLKGKIIPIVNDHQVTGGLGFVYPHRYLDSLEYRIFEQDSLIYEVEKLAKIGRWEADLITDYAYWSDGMYDIFELDRLKHMKHKEFINYLHADDVERVLNVINEVVNTKKTIYFDYRIRTENNKLKYAHGRAKPILDKSGTVTKLIGFVQDITERKYYENFLSGVLNSSIAGLVVLKAVYDLTYNDIIDFKVVYVNEPAETFLGAGVEVLKDKSINEYYPIFKNAGFLDVLRSVVVTGETVSKEYSYVHNGSKVWIKFTAAKFDDKCVVSFQDISASINSLEEIRKSHLFLYQSQEAANVGSFEWNFADEKFKFTPEFYKIFEFDFDEDINYEAIYARIDAADKLSVITCVKQAISNPCTCECDFKICVPSGREAYCWVKAIVVVDENDNTQRFVGSIMDVTLRKKAEQAFEETNKKLERTTLSLKELNEQLENKITDRTKELLISNERFKLISKATKDAIWDWDLTTNELWFNEMFQNTYGITHYDPMSSYEFWKAGLHPDDRVRVVEGIESAIALGKESWHDEYRFLKKDGMYVFIMDRGFILHGENNKPVRMVGSMTEVSNIHHVEERLRESESNYRFLSESMPQLVWIINQRGEGLYTNRKWSEYTGQEFEQYRGEGWLNCVHPDDLEGIRKAWAECVKEGQAYKREHRIRSLDGQYRWFLSRAVPMKDNGNINRWIGTSTDIHEHKKLLDNLELTKVKLNEANEQLNERNNRLKVINNDLDNFVYAASHDLRSPVRNIESLLHMLKDEFKEWESNEKISYLCMLLFKSLESLKITIKDLTELARFDENTVGRESVLFQEVVDDVSVALQDLIEKSNAIIKSDLQIREVHFLKNNLRAILYNLISNAIKYKSRNRDPLIFVRTFMEGNYTVLQIEDNGKGIREEDMGKVFAPFKRISDEVEGTGIGMWIVKRIIDNNGGKIEIKSEVDKGTIFNVYIKTV